MYRGHENSTQFKFLCRASVEMNIRCATFFFRRLNRCGRVEGGGGEAKYADKFRFDDELSLTMLMFE